MQEKKETVLRSSELYEAALYDAYNDGYQAGYEDGLTRSKDNED